MKTVLPDFIKQLPLADIPLKGIEAYLAQEKENQIIFMRFEEDAVLPTHSHKAQWGIVLEGQIDLTIEGITKTYRKGDNYLIPEGVEHSGKIYAGYADITIFNQKDRYSTK